MERVAMVARFGKRFGAAVIVGAYLLTLLTQIPHVYDVYSSLERQDHSLAIWGVVLSTAWGAAIAFEISVAIFTWRLIVNTSAYRSKWTRRGVAGFLILSFIANLSYYFDWVVGPVSLDTHIMPFLLAAALPLALWLYAEEFGAETGTAVKRAERQMRKAERERAKEPHFDYAVENYLCWCGEWMPDAGRHTTKAQARGALGAHSKVHRAQAKSVLSQNGASTGDVTKWFLERYKDSRDGKSLPRVPQAWEIAEWRVGPEIESGKNL